MTIKPKDMERLLKVLANKRRLEIVSYLKTKKESTVSAISGKIKLSFKATSKHLSILYGADLVAKEQRSLQVFYRLSPEMPHIAKQISNSLE